MKTGKAVGIALTAGAVSAGAALLFAPQSGVRTRRMFRRKAEDIGEGFREAYHQVVEKSNGAGRLAYRWKMILTPKKTAEHWSRV